MRRFVPLIGFVFLLSACSSTPVGLTKSLLEDENDTFLYPPVVVSDSVLSKAKTVEEISATDRELFVSKANILIMNRPYPPVIAAQAAGIAKTTLVITALEDGRLNTPYRARAVLSQLTAFARQTPLFQDHEVADEFSFIEYATILGFKRIVLTDGRRYTYEIVIAHTLQKE